MILKLKSFIMYFSTDLTGWTFLHNQHKQYDDRRRETTIVPDWKQPWNQFNNKNNEKIQFEEL